MLNLLGRLARDQGARQRLGRILFMRSVIYLSYADCQQKSSLTLRPLFAKRLSRMARYSDMTDEERKVVQRNCARFREELGAELGEELTQYEIAQLSGLSHDSIRNFEQGRRIPDVTSLRRLGQVFGRRVDDFFEENPPPPDPALRMVAVRAKIIGRLDDDLRDQVYEFVANINHKQLERIKALKDKHHREEQARRAKERK